MVEFHVFYKKGALPPVPELNRAMSSRGFAIELQGDAPPHERGEDLGLTVDGKPVAVSVSLTDAQAPEWAALRAAAADAVDGAARLSVLKNCDVRLTLKADGDDARWARDVARNVGLLACGAYENLSASRFINFGR